MSETNIQIAAQLYTVRAYTQTEESIASTLKKIKKIGYDCVQISAFGPCRTEFLRDQLQENELEVCATHTAYERIVEDTDNVIREHKLLNIPYVGLGGRKTVTIAETENFLKEILPAARKIRDAGLQFIYHNHHREFIRLENGQTVMQYLLEHTSAEEFGLLPDLYWLQFAGVNPALFLKEHADRISVVHLKDLCIAEGNSGTEEQRYAEIFEGNMDYDGLQKVLTQTGVRYAAVEQDDCYGKDPFECLLRSRDNLRKHWGI